MSDLYRLLDIDSDDPEYGLGNNDTMYRGRVEPVEPDAVIKIERSLTPPSWDAEYDDNDMVISEPCVVYSCDGCGAVWSLPDGTYAIVWL